jgi:hypothetical protein
MPSEPHPRRMRPGDAVRLWASVCEQRVMPDGATQNVASLQVEAVSRTADLRNPGPNTIYRLRQTSR